MKYQHLIILLALGIVACSPKQEAKKTVKEFVEASISANCDYSFNDFGKLDSTRYVTDSALLLMRSQAEKDAAFKSELKYGRRAVPKEQLKYMNVKMTINEKDTTYTFYLTNDLKQVVSFK